MILTDYNCFRTVTLFFSFNREAREGFSFIHWKTSFSFIQENMTAPELNDYLKIFRWDSFSSHPSASAIAFITALNRAKHQFPEKQEHIFVILPFSKQCGSVTSWKSVLLKLSDVIVLFRPKRLTLKGYKQYWFKFQDTSICYFKSKEESIGEPIQQINLKGTEYIIVFFIIMIFPCYVTNNVLSYQ